MKVAIAYHEGMLSHRPPPRKDGKVEHEIPPRIEWIRNELNKSGLMDRCLKVALSKDSEDLCMACIRAIHKDKYIEGIQEKKFASKEDEDNSVYFCEATHKAAVIAASLLIEMCEGIVLGRYTRGFAVIRPPGHHAHASKAYGFCYYNNVAIATRYLIERHGLKKILVVDWDYHHGDGISEIFYNTNEVLYFSIHGFGPDIFPETGPVHEIGSGKGVGYNINVPLYVPRLSRVTYGDGDYLSVWEEVLLPIVKEFQPQFILVSAGFDAADGDMGGFKVTASCYSKLLEKLLPYAKGNIALALEGGYDETVLPKCARACVETLLGECEIGESEMPKSSTINKRTTHIISEIRSILAPYWGCFQAVETSAAGGGGERGCFQEVETSCAGGGGEGGGSKNAWEKTELGKDGALTLESSSDRGEVGSRKRRRKRK